MVAGVDSISTRSAWCTAVEGTNGVECIAEEPAAPLEEASAKETSLEGRACRSDGGDDDGDDDEYGMQPLSCTSLRSNW